ncbi:hypothetical protein AAY473_005413 [Plecturocebus cupreus]
MCRRTKGPWRSLILGVLCLSSFLTSDWPRDRQEIRRPAGGSQNPLHSGFRNLQENKELSCSPQAELKRHADYRETALERTGHTCDRMLHPPPHTHTSTHSERSMNTHTHADIERHTETSNSRTETHTAASS